MPQLDTSTFPTQLFWLGVCFITLYLILSYIALPKITSVLKIREETIEEKINKASMYREQAEGLLADYESSLAQTREAAHQRYKSVAHLTSAEISQQQKEFLEKLKDRLHLAEQQLFREGVQDQQEITSLAADIALVILKKITGKSYSPDDLLKGRKGS